MIHGNTKHGAASDRKQTKEYTAWRCARSRCNNPHHKAYARYGGRGIKCEISFHDFLLAAGPKPGLNYSIDRIDNNKGYEKGNLRWATRQEQSANRRPSKPYKNAAPANTKRAKYNEYMRNWYRSKKEKTV